MAEKSLLTRCDEAARGHEATHGDGSHSLFHEVGDEMRRLYAIEKDVRALLIYSGKAQPGSNAGRYWDPFRQEYTTLEQIAERRVEAGKRLMDAVKG